MNTVVAIFQRQLNDFSKNMGVSMMYFIWPGLAFLMGQFMGEYAAPQIAMFAGMFVASAPMIAIANTVAEDVEYKSLRFLVMAGVKPFQYLLGLSLSILILSAASVAAFVFIGEFAGAHLQQFLMVAGLGVIASILLGGVVGIFAKNVQQASMIYTPLMMALMFLPMLSMFNETIASIARFVFSYQVLAIVLGTAESFASALMIVGANILVFLVLFALAYGKKGLRG